LVDYGKRNLQHKIINSLVFIELELKKAPENSGAFFMPKSYWMFISLLEKLRFYIVLYKIT
jgi:hypothetical protein